MSNKIEDVREFVSVLEKVTKFLDSNSVMIKVKDNSISQLSAGKTFFYEFQSEVPDFTCWNAISLLSVIKALTSKSADHVILPTITVEEDFIMITTVDDGMKLPLADTSMVEHEGDYSDIYDVDTEIDLSKVIERLSKLSYVTETETIRLNIGDDDIVNSIESTNEMTKASYKKVLHKGKGKPFDFSKDFFNTLNGLKDEYETFIDIDRCEDDDDEIVCSLIASIPVIKKDEEVKSRLYIFIENEEDLMK